MINSTSIEQLLIYLLNCAVNSRPPKNLPEDIDFDQLRELSRFHSVASMVSFALDAGGYLSEQYMTESQKNFWITSRITAMRKRTMFDLERKAILQHFEEKGVWYMPLKGCILQDLYPEFGMREMADNDILFDQEYREGLRDYMVEQGYEVKLYNRFVHDVYVKKPFYNFEFHVGLVDEDMHPQASDYYENVKDRLQKDEDCEYGYHFSDEDFYIYMMVHAFKHYHSAGVGVRILSDIYVYLDAKGSTLDMAYVEGELTKLGYGELERQFRVLALELFQPEKELAEIVPGNEADCELLDFMFGSGTYGTVTNWTELKLAQLQGEKDQLDTGDKLRFLAHRLFPDAKHMGKYAPFCKKHKWAIPFFWGYRIVRGIPKGGERIIRELKAVRNTK